MVVLRVRAAAAASLICLGLWLVAACSLADGRGSSRGGAPDFADVRARIQELVARGAPSVAVAVVADGAILWEEAFGFEDVASRRRATPHSRYAIGSVSKPFTATVIMVLAERGEIDLSACPAGARSRCTIAAPDACPPRPGRAALRALVRAAPRARQPGRRGVRCRHGAAAPLRPAVVDEAAPAAAVRRSAHSSPSSPARASSRARSAAAR
jgi:Beta-lactamase